MDGVQDLVAAETRVFTTLPTRDNAHRMLLAMCRCSTPVPLVVCREFPRVAELLRTHGTKDMLQCYCRVMRSGMFLGHNTDALDMTRTAKTYTPLLCALTGSWQSFGAVCRVLLRVGDNCMLYDDGVDAVACAAFATEVPKKVRSVAMRLLAVLRDDVSCWGKPLRSAQFTHQLLDPDVASGLTKKGRAAFRSLVQAAALDRERMRELPANMAEDLVACLSV